MGKLTLFVNESANDPAKALVSSLNSDAPAEAIVFTQGDLARPVEIHFLKDNPDRSGNGNRFVYSTAPGGVQLGVGRLDQPVTGGKFEFADAGAVQEGEADYNADATAFQTALRAALSTNFATATVTGSLAAGYSIDRIELGAFSSFAVDPARLFPVGSVEELVQSDPGTTERSAKWFLKLVQPPAIGQNSFSAVTYDVPAITSETTGSAGVNAVHRLTWPGAAYGGSVSISQKLPTGTAKPITSNTNASPTVVTATAHGLSTGDQITIPANNGSNASILGVHTVTVSDADTFTIPVNCTTSGGTGGTFYKLATATVGPIPYNAGGPTIEELLAEHTSSLAEDGSFAVEKVEPGNYLVSFKGDLAGLPIPVGAITSSLSLPVAVEGVLNCQTSQVVALLGASDSTTAPLEIERTDDGNPTTIAYRPSVTIRAELLSSEANPYYQTITGYAAIYRPDIDSFSDLAAVETAGGRIKFIIVNISGSPLLWELLPGTDATDTAGGIQRPGDYNGSTNANVWKAVISSPLVPNVQTGDYTLALPDAGKYVRMNKASAVNLTVPANASVAIPIGSQVLIDNMGAGQVTVVADGGVTVNTSQTLLLRAQHSHATLIKVGTNEWNLIGDLESA